MRRPNLTRMRKVNMATINALYPVRYLLGLPADCEIPDFTPGAIWALADADVTFERRPKRVKRWVMRAVEDR